MMSAAGKPNSAPGGFTLLEVLLAFVILTVALSFLAAQFGRHLKTLQLLQDALEAQRLAEGQLIQELIHRQMSWPPPQDLISGKFVSHLAYSQDQFEWEPAQVLQLDHVASQVSWERPPPSRSLEVTVGLPPPAGE